MENWRDLEFKILGKKIEDIKRLEFSTYVDSENYGEVTLVLSEEEYNALVKIGEELGYTHNNK